tara:strand:- start:229 stop:489 length:261 start_codon:yes stop_codon:yes gene_type:complete
MYNRDAHNKEMKIPTTLLTETCTICGFQDSFIVDNEDLHAWKEGAIIQDVLAYLEADQRELLISQTCGSCFDKMFPPNEEDNCFSC